MENHFVQYSFVGEMVMAVWDGEDKAKEKRDSVEVWGRIWGRGGGGLLRCIGVTTTISSTKNIQ